MSGCIAERGHTQRDPPPLTVVGGLTFAVDHVALGGYPSTGEL